MQLPQPASLFDARTSKSLTLRVRKAATRIKRCSISAFQLHCGRFLAVEASASTRYKLELTAAAMLAC